MEFLKRRNLIFLMAVAAAGLTLFAVMKGHQGSALRVGIAPYQDIAMIVNVGPLGLERKYGTQLELVTMSWEDIPPAVASAGRAIDVGFGSLIEFITKYDNINAGSSDPVLFIYPAYAFKGGSFVSFNKEVPVLDRAAIRDVGSSAVKRWLQFRIGAQRGSVYEMMLFDLARTHGVPFGQVKIIDTPLDQGFLAAEQGSLDIAEAGLTQMTEAVRRGARVVLTMEEMGIADLTGFIVRKSVYDNRRRDVENLVRMWFDTVAFVFADIDTNSKASLEYLNRTASTRYTLQEYKRALSQEYFPTNLAEAKAQLIDKTGRFSAQTIAETTNAYLLERGIIKRPAPLPVFGNIVSTAN